ncbi:MAG: APC family permease [Lachnospiraceae bacterium]|nr:APC family permease [Lachnospiraceae bacterium]MEE0918483.1 APC family permease [Lachnospiraceae bacterium]
MEKKLGLFSAIATGVGLIVATSCLMSLGQGASILGTGFIITMILACLINILTALSMAELNALMPNLTGGLAQYTLAGMGPFITILTMVGGYLVCQMIAGTVECAMFGNAINSVFDTGIPSWVLSVIMVVILMFANLHGVDLFAKVQNVVAYVLIGSLIIMGVIGAFGLGTGEIINQPSTLAESPADTLGLLGLGFFLFIGCEFVIPIAKSIKNERRNVPLGMVLSLVIILIMQILLVIGMTKYTAYDDLGASASPHILYGTSLLGNIGSYWMILVSALAVVSTVNSAMSSFSFMCAGMAKINLLPTFFLKKNKNGAFYIGIYVIGLIEIIVNAIGLSTSDSLIFMINVAIVFWMISYIISNINVVIFRIKLPKAPRTFKVPFGPVLPIIAAIGTAFMIWNISNDPEARKLIFLIDGVIFIILGIYSVLWCKIRVKRPLFKPIPMHEVMAMENDAYLLIRRKRK